MIRKITGVIRKISAVWAVHHKSFCGSSMLKVDFFIPFFKEKQLLYKFTKSSNLGSKNQNQLKSVYFRRSEVSLEVYSVKWLKTDNAKVHSIQEGELNSQWQVSH